MLPRKVTLDPDGRLALAPSDRLRLGVVPGDQVEFFLADGQIVLRKRGCALNEDRSQLPCFTSAAEAAAGHCAEAVAGCCAETPPELRETPAPDDTPA